MNKRDNNKRIMICRVFYWWKQDIYSKIFKYTFSKEVNGHWPVFSHWFDVSLEEIFIAGELELFKKEESNVKVYDGN